MAAKVVDELRLMDFARCPLRVGKGVVNPTPPLFEAALKALEWVLCEAFDGRVAESRRVREEVERYWHRFATLPMSTHDSERIVRIGRRLAWLAARYEVLMPVTNYQISFGRTRLEGEYAVLRDARRHHRTALVLRLQFGHPTLAPGYSRPGVMPDLVTLARWIHASESSGYEQCAVYHYWVTQDVSHLEVPPHGAARSALRSVVSALESDLRYPAPGAHCGGCKTVGCAVLRQE